MCNCCKSGIYIGGSFDTALTDGDTVPVGAITWAYGKNVRKNGNAIVLCGCNKAFAIEGSFTVEAASTDPITLTVLQDGVVVPGGTFEITVAGTSANTIIPIHTVVKNECKSSSSITFEISGQDTTLSAESLIIEEWGQ